MLDNYATDTNSEYVILIAFPQQQWYKNAPQYYVHAYIFSLVLYVIFKIKLVGYHPVVGELRLQRSLISQIRQDEQINVSVLVATITMNQKQPQIHR